VRDENAVDRGARMKYIAHRQNQAH